MQKDVFWEGWRVDELILLALFFFNYGKEGTFCVAESSGDLAGS